MPGLIIGVTIAALVCCTGIVLTLCARAPREENPSDGLSRLDLMDGLGTHATTPTTPTRPAERSRGSERVA